MPTEVSRAVVRTYLKEVSGRDKTPEVLSEYVSSEGLIEHILDIESAFPRYTLEILDLVAEDDRVAARLLFRGTHRGDFHGIEPTNREATMSVAAFYRVEEGRIAEAWIQADGTDLVEQLMAD